MQKILQGDTVYVHTGKDKGKTGVVKQILKQLDHHERGLKFKILIDEINMVTKHIRGNPNNGTESRRAQIAKPVDYSNVAIFNIATQKPDRVKTKLLENGEKIRIYRSTGEMIPNNVSRKGREKTS
jgi:large subunit ribosomal protein L24